MAQIICYICISIKELKKLCIKNNYFQGIIVSAGIIAHLPRAEMAQSVGHSTRHISALVHLGSWDIIAPTTSTSVREIHVNTGHVKIHTVLTSKFEYIDICQKIYFAVTSLIQLIFV